MKTPNTPTPQFIVIGAGLSGLVLARELTHHYGPHSVKVLEKSRGLGGRLATRRGNSTRFDHGSPEIPNSIHEILGVPPDLARKEGATALAKALGSDLHIEKNSRATRIVKESDHWSILCEDERVFEATHVVLTAPLPQALELLQQSSISIPESLPAIHYDKAVVVLSENCPGKSALSPPIESLMDEHQKGISPAPAWTLIFSPQWSEANFDLDEPALREKVIREIQHQSPDFRPNSDSGFSMEIKKWRYSKPQKTLKEPYMGLSSAPGLYLCGDAFSGSPSESFSDPRTHEAHFALQNAIQSAFALARHFGCEPQISRPKTIKG